MRFEYTVYHARQNFAKVLKQVKEGHDVVILWAGDRDQFPYPIVRIIPYTEKVYFMGIDTGEGDKGVEVKINETDR